MYSDRDTHCWVGCPIRISMDQRLLAAPHGFSQRATSFIASWCQGIHRTPFSCSQPRDIQDRSRTSHLAQEPSNLLLRRKDLSPSTGSHRITSMGSLGLPSNKFDGVPPMPPHPNRLREQPIRRDGRAIKHIHSLYASEHLRLRGFSAHAPPPVRLATGASRRAKP